MVTGRRGANGALLANDPGVQRTLGLMDANLRTAWWALLGALNDMGEDYILDEETVSRLQIAKRTVVMNLAMDTVGGASYFKCSLLARAYRDVRAAPIHPLTPEKSLQFAGRLALGLSTQ